MVFPGNRVQLTKKRGVFAMKIASWIIIAIVICLFARVIGYSSKYGWFDHGNASESIEAAEDNSKESLNGRNS